MQIKTSFKQKNPENCVKKKKYYIFIVTQGKQIICQKGVLL